MSQPDFFGDDRGGQMRGVAVGIVTDNEDPKGIGRVKLAYPWRETDDESYWARVATPMAGDGYGAYFLPEVGDEVLVAFDDGDIHHPYVIGALWNGRRAPPTENEGNNDLREIQSRSGHRIDMDDASNAGKIEIETSAGHTITLDDTAGSEVVRIEDKTGSNTIEMNSTSGEVAIDASSKISLSASTIELSADGEVSVSSDGKVDLSSNAKMNLSSNAQVTLSSNGMMNVNSSGPMRIQGAIIQLN